MINRLVPSAIATAETRKDCSEIALFPEEERCVDRADDMRRCEFVTGRACARQALQRLGLAPRALLKGAHGEPLWPAGVVGSITHCSGYYACAVGRADEVMSIGIDAEVNAPLPEHVLERVLFGHECEAVSVGAVTGNGAAVCVDRLLFSAKEAVFKAWFPLTRRWLGVKDMQIAIDMRQRTFSARLLVPDPILDGIMLREMRGRWCVQTGVICAAVVLGARHS